MSAPTLCRAMFMQAMTMGMMVALSASLSFLLPDRKSRESDLMR